MLSEYYTPALHNKHTKEMSKDYLAGFTSVNYCVVLFCMGCFVCFFFPFFFICNAGILQVPICPDFYYLFFYNLVYIMRDRDQFDN